MSNGLRRDEADPSPSSVTKDGDCGLSAIFVCEAGPSAVYLHISDSIEEILGWAPREMIGRSPYDFIDAEEIPYIESSHYQASLRQKTAFVQYFRMRHKRGHHVNICLASSFANDRSMGLISLRSEGLNLVQQARTAREVIEITRDGEKDISLRHWSGPGAPDTSRSTPPIAYEPGMPWPPRGPSPPRTAFMLDRFTETAIVLFVTNDAIANTGNMINQPFYSIVKPSDRELVRSHIEAAKQWSPVRYKADKTGGYGYAKFSVLRIPDLPPAGSRMPQSTDEAERMMPGQSFIAVEGIFTAGSDGVICNIERLAP